MNNVYGMIESKSLYNLISLWVYKIIIKPNIHKSFIVHTNTGISLFGYRFFRYFIFILSKYIIMCIGGLIYNNYENVSLR